MPDDQSELRQAFQVWCAAGRPDEAKHWASRLMMRVALKRLQAQLPPAGPDAVEIEVDRMFK